MLKAQYGSEGNEIIIQKATRLELDYFVLRLINFSPSSHYPFRIT